MTKHDATARCYSTMLQHDATAQCYSDATTRCYSTMLQHDAPARWYSTMLQHRHSAATQQERDISTKSGTYIPAARRKAVLHEVFPAHTSPSQPAQHRRKQRRVLSHHALPHHYQTTTTTPTTCQHTTTAPPPTQETQRHDTNDAKHTARHRNARPLGQRGGNSSHRQPTRTCAWRLWRSPKFGRLVSC